MFDKGWMPPTKKNGKLDPQKKLKIGWSGKDDMEGMSEGHVEFHI